MKTMEQKREVKAGNPKKELAKKRKGKEIIYLYYITYISQQIKA